MRVQVWNTDFHFYWEAGSDIKKEKVCGRPLIFQSTYLDSQMSGENADATKYQMIKLPPPQRPPTSPRASSSKAFFICFSELEVCLLGYHSSEKYP